MQFLNEYGELGTVKTGYRAEELLRLESEASGAEGVVQSNYIINSKFWLFLFFLMVVEVV